MYLYQYLPIKMIGERKTYLPDQLAKFGYFIEKCISDFRDVLGRDPNEHYIYLTAKCMFMSSGKTINRPGWHCDGFGTNDINYIWSDCVPTQYIEGDFSDVPEGEMESLAYFEDLGISHIMKGLVKSCEPCTIYRLDQSVIHACAAYIGHPILRHFAKVSFSKEKYNLKGNSHNYLIDYDWKMVDRTMERNVTSK